MTLMEQIGFVHVRKGQILLISVSVQGFEFLYHLQNTV